ncbi:hypothetical protein DFQ11_1313 [Winogradskyella epiphytica]|uniref:Uncharacterized protein n=1 Tax=Winogradskyella epiphytica TaxID=262005 RepID=A0A2V4XB95_9FLAO|nr:hypothetical protein [Winogradskyella epiphytica]PYE78485.1 hypothetical protein DFQ11_1313 [Winogradskyella epiphytica]GGW75660.1 hypothetical protein GCM10008085_29270 [Winogradskyella epiphytica]
MKNIFYTLLIGILFFSCTDEPDLNNYNLEIQNNSNENLNIKAYFEGNLISNVNLSTNQSGLECSYNDENFRGLFSNQCNIDSLIIRFSNDKGYIVNDEGSGTLNFSNDRNPFLPNGGFDINNNNYSFLITQEDFDNAHDLP